jgi:hypothetical protein
MNEIVLAATPKPHLSVTEIVLKDQGVRDLSGETFVKRLPFRFAANLWLGLINNQTKPAQSHSIYGSVAQRVCAKPICLPDSRMAINSGVYFLRKGVN